MDFKVDKGNELKEHVSPEGIEEKIIMKHEFLLTQTQGGKFRVYQDGIPIRTVDTEESAKNGFVICLQIAASMIDDPKKTIEIILNSLAAKKGE